jgi:hypothetical protein
MQAQKLKLLFFSTILLITQNVSSNLLAQGHFENELESSLQSLEYREVGNAELAGSKRVKAQVFKYSPLQNELRKLWVSGRLSPASYRGLLNILQHYRNQGQTRVPTLDDLDATSYEELILRFPENFQEELRPIAAIIPIIIIVAVVVLTLSDDQDPISSELDFFFPVSTCQAPTLFFQEYSGMPKSSEDILRDLWDQIVEIQKEQDLDPEVQDALICSEIDAAKRDAASCGTKLILPFGFEEMFPCTE